jgi:hypothetical protein
MPRFTIVPAARTARAAEVTSPDAAVVLHPAARLECGDADVFENERYVFSLRLGENGLWQIYRRAEPMEPVSAFG